MASDVYAACERLGKPYYDDGGGRVVYCGDCREMLPLIEPGSVDLVLTDPQYGISSIGPDFHRPDGKGTRRYQFFGDDGHDAALGTAQCALEYSVACCHMRSSLYVWVAHRQFGKVIEMLEVRGFTTRFVVWSKKVPAPPPPGSGWPSGAELCVYAYKTGRTWNPAPGDPPYSNVLLYDSYRHGQPGKVGHPTQKPLGLFRELVRYSSSPSSCVLDPFMGSGTSVFAAKLEGRQAIGIEISERYCEIAANRLSQGVLF